MQPVFGGKALHFESGQTKPFKQKIGAIDKVQALEDWNRFYAANYKPPHRTVHSFSLKIAFIA